MPRALPILASVYAVALGCSGGGTADGGTRADGAPDATPTEAAVGTDASDATDASDPDASQPDGGADAGGGTDAGGGGPRCPDDLSGHDPVAGPQGIMIQTHTATDRCLLERALDHICNAHRGSGPGVIHDVVLTDAIAVDGAGELTETLEREVLDLVLDYSDCWDNLFIGTIPGSMLDDPYASSTIMDESARWRWLNAARRVADRVRDYMAEAAPAMAWHWYISYEANLNHFTNDSYRAAYVALLDQHVRDLQERHGPATVAWSPTFWTDPSDLSSGARSTLEASLADLFNRVPGIDWVVVQDHVGVDTAFSCTDALTYYSLVQSAGPELASVQINVEYFDLTDGSIGPGDPSELADRVQCYLDAGASLGASFDFRYWYPTHGH